MTPDPRLLSRDAFVTQIEGAGFVEEPDGIHWVREIDGRCVYVPHEPGLRAEWTRAELRRIGLPSQPDMPRVRSPGCCPTK